MTNKKLQGLTKKTILQVGNLRNFYNGSQYNPFPIGRKYAYNLARGKFDQCGKHGLLIMKDYFLKLENDKENG